MSRKLDELLSFIKNENNKKNMQAAIDLFYQTCENINLIYFSDQDINEFKKEMISFVNDYENILKQNKSSNDIEISAINGLENITKLIGKFINNHMN